MMIKTTVTRVGSVGAVETRDRLVASIARRRREARINWRMRTGEGTASPSERPATGLRSTGGERP